jgi:hypothetical protein
VNTVRLNATGSLVWQVLGEDFTVDEMAAEFASAFGTSPEAMLGDLTPMLGSLVSAGLVEEVSQAPRSEPSPVEEQPVYLTIPPCGCLHTVDDMEWVATTPLRVGREIFGLRTNDMGAHQLLASAFEQYVIDDPQAVGYYSVELDAEPSDESPLRLWEGNTVLCRTQSTSVLWDRLLVAVSSHLSPEPGALRLSMITAVGPRGAALIPSIGLTSLYDQRSDLAAAGILLADGPTDLDLVTGEVIVRLGVDVDEDAAAAFSRLLPGRPRIAAAEPGRAPVIAVPTPPSVEGDVLGRLHAVATAVLPTAQNAGGLGGEVVLGGLERLAASPAIEAPLDWDDWVPLLVDTLT